MQKTKVEILNTIRPKFETLERQRQLLQVAQKRQQNLGVAIGVSLVLVVSVCIQVLLGFDAIVLFWILFTGPFIAYGIQKRFIRPTKVDFQQEVSNTISQAMYPDLQFGNPKGLENKVYLITQIFGQFGQVRGRNPVEGKHGDTHFMLFNMHRIEDEQDNDAAYHGGLGVIFDFHKNTKGTTLVMPDKTQQKFGGWFGKLIQEFGRKGQQLVSLEDPEFEKTFVVYSKDQIEARYVLTPAMMDNLLSLSRKYGNRIYYAFSVGKVYMVIDGIVPFRVGVDLPLQTDQIFYNFIYPIELVKEIIDILNLNTRIWTKE